MERNPDECLHYLDSGNQRKSERLRGEGDSGTVGYEIVGCYSCEGFNKECSKFLSINSLKEKSLEAELT